jgi:hypothetical protein
LQHLDPTSAYTSLVKEIEAEQIAMELIYLAVVFLLFGLSFWMVRLLEWL